MNKRTDSYNPFCSYTIKKHTIPWSGCLFSFILRSLGAVLLLFGLLACAPAGQHVPSDSTEQISGNYGNDTRQTFPSGIAQQPQPFSHIAQSSQQKYPSSAPRFKAIAPMDSQRISMSFVKEDIRAVLQALAHATGLNLVISPKVNSIIENHTITAEYNERTAKEILDSVCKMADIAWRQETDTIYIEPTARRIFHLDFLSAVNKSDFKVGGDVLGSGSGGGGSSGGNTINTSQLTGSFELSGSVTDSVTDIYKGIEDSLKERIGQNGQFFLNRQTGILTVNASPRTLDDIESMINALRKQYRRQALIEAKILEVELSDGNEFGIDWRNFEATLSKSALKNTPLSANIAGNLTSNNMMDKIWDYGITLSNRYYNINMVFHALKQYGNIKTLSNPRLKVMNGQPAIISVGQSISYLKSLQSQTTTTGNQTNTNPEVELSAVFDGVLLGITPIIEEDGHVTLHIVPIKSELVSMEERQFGGTGTGVGANVYTFPKVNLREASTIVRAMPGEIVVLGGLIQDRTATSNAQVPVLSSLPIVGNAFTYKTQYKRSVELVIVMQIQVRDDE